MIHKHPSLESIGLHMSSHCHKPVTVGARIVLTSILVFLQTPLAGFGFDPNVFGKYFPDRLHSGDLGPAQLVKVMIQQHPDCVARLDQLNEYIKHLPSFPGFNLPSFGLTSGQRATAYELADLFKILPVAILAVTSLRTTFLPAAQGLFLSFNLLVCCCNNMPGGSIVGIPVCRAFGVPHSKRS